MEVIRPIDHPIATGVHPDMPEHGWEQDAGGIPAWGNQPQAWESGEHLGLDPHPEYR